jgi:hypothetical protein
MVKSATFIDLFRGVQRRRTLLCIACGLFQTAGSTFLVNCAWYFFLIAGQSQPLEEIDEISEMNVPARKFSLCLYCGIQQASKLSTLKQSTEKEKTESSLMIYVMYNLY